jgi:hypothetical protein
VGALQRQSVVRSAASAPVQSGRRGVTATRQFAHFIFAGLRSGRRVHKVFHVDLPLNALFEGPTVKQLAVAIQESLLAQIEALPEEEAARLLAG